MTKLQIASEFARRAKQFHTTTEPMEINLWGLFQLGTIEWN